MAVGAVAKCVFSIKVCPGKNTMFIIVIFCPFLFLFSLSLCVCICVWVVLCLSGFLICYLAMADRQHRRPLNSRRIGARVRGLNTFLSSFRTFNSFAPKSKGGPGAIVIHAKPTTMLKNPFWPNEKNNPTAVSPNWSEPKSNNGKFKCVKRRRMARASTLCKVPM